MCGFEEATRMSLLYPGQQTHRINNQESWDPDDRIVRAMDLKLVIHADGHDTGVAWLNGSPRNTSVKPHDFLCRLTTWYRLAKGGFWLLQVAT
ncbi:hypothetical protein AVEN_245116-1 [Araneus ventricosus]|uniref:Uncharacterized protein n=1 Tax=Araneus ventricosus TaxID=182803 RepID=A0A4Y2SGI8_ARAVE|nr:hypothetical protein AVEN_245116-1 [Araneus ventricosus]